MSHLAAKGPNLSILSLAIVNVMSALPCRAQKEVKMTSSVKLLLIFTFLLILESVNSHEISTSY